MSAGSRAFDRLHPAVQYHVVNSLGWASLRPTQLDAIEPIHAGRHCLLLAPTAGGKTEAAFIPVLSRMAEEGWQGTSVLYVCPIKALLNNLEPRLTRYAGLLGRRVEVWHGDVAATLKRRLLADPPDVLLTTPESLEGMLVSTRVERQRWFGKLQVVIADELHALAADDRGWHLRAVLARIDAYCPRPLQRIGLSATVGNPQELLDWFAPVGDRQVVGSSAVSTDADVTVDHVGSLDNAAIVISRLHRGEKRLVFCDSRSSAEKLGAALNQMGVRSFVSHASLSASERRQAEAAFAEERDCVIVATSTLELGIDVGDLDRVIQIDAPSSVGSFLQRMGRSGRRAGGRRNCLFLATNDSALLTALGVLHLWAQGWVEAAVPPPEPWNVVAQQALLMTLEAGQVTVAALRGGLSRSFPELHAGDVADLIEHLAETGYLARDDAGLLQIGPKAEREFGGGHYRDLMATFTGAALLTARHGASEVGYLDPAVLAGQGDSVIVLLAGRSWRVREVDWRRRQAWLEPAKEGGRARWTGTGRDMSAELASAIRAVLVSGEVAGVTLSRRATAALETLRDETPASLEGPQVRTISPGRFRLWTYAGSVSNRTLMLARKGVGACAFDGLGVDFRVDPRLSEARTSTYAPSAADYRVLAEGTKFTDLLPLQLVAREVDSRLLVDAARSGGR
ncbi:MAG: DEAD/DEAH box helicase [Burkholderiales bacterium]|nr:DEAD/DEAH box helicase [Burkholderiales bacterium]